MNLMNRYCPTYRMNQCCLMYPTNLKFQRNWSLRRNQKHRKFQRNHWFHLWTSQNCQRNRMNPTGLYSRWNPTNLNFQRNRTLRFHRNQKHRKFRLNLNFQKHLPVQSVPLVPLGLAPTVESCLEELLAKPAR